MSFRTMFGSKAPYHIFLYSLAFGATTYESFFSAIVAFKTLPREEFGKLQAKIFPPFFALQTVAPPLLMLTSPFPLATASKVCLSIAGLGGFINLAFLNPWSRDIKQQRKQLKEEEIKAGTWVEGEESPEMKSLTKKFGIIHGFSLLADMTAFAGLTGYGLLFSKRIVSLLGR